jgi:hypothetical protein
VLDDEVLTRRQRVREPDLGPTVGHAVGDRARGLGLGDADDHALVGAPEPAHRDRDRIGRERGQGDQVERAGLELGDGLDRLSGEPCLAQHPAGRAQERLARSTQHHAPPDPVEQRRPELGFEPRDPLRERRLRDVESCRGGGERAGIDDADHVLDLPQIHRYILSNK